MASLTSVLRGLAKSVHLSMQLGAGVWVRILTTHFGSLLRGRIFWSRLARGLRCFVGGELFLARLYLVRTVSVSHWLARTAFASWRTLAPLLSPVAVRAAHPGQARTVRRTRCWTWLSNCEMGSTFLSCVSRPEKWQLAGTCHLAARLSPSIHSSALSQVGECPLQCGAVAGEDTCSVHRPSCHFSQILVIPASRQVTASTVVSGGGSLWNCRVVAAWKLVLPCARLLDFWELFVVRCTSRLVRSQPEVSIFSLTEEEEELSLQGCASECGQVC